MHGGMLVLAALFGSFSFSTVQSQDPPPRVLADGFRLQQVAAAPDIVTPVAIAFDGRGELLVIESHTHQRPDGYDGPEHDRIRRVVDQDRDGRADSFTTFHEGTAQTMSLALGPDGWIYVATRREILRLRDSDADGRADEQESIVRLHTPGDYPHNGLSGLTFDPSGQLVWGLGENLGEPYRLVTRTGESLEGAGEGGSIFVCEPSGERLRRLATGFWNPFGNAYDPHGRLFSVDNDPDASPPCRLLHVVTAGDYGYQFRYGRSGRNPLQAWDAELPATLPMAAGTGEAPCQIVPYRGRMWVTSWGDFRIEAYTLTTHGATCQAQLEVIVQGDARFRPVGLAVAPDGSLYFSDWVDRSYPVHGAGRIWRLIPPADRAADGEFPELSTGERRARSLEQATQRDQLLHAALDDDPFIRQAAIAGLAAGEPASLDVTGLSHPRQRVAALAAIRWRQSDGLSRWLDRTLADPDDDVCLMSLRVIAEQHRREFRESIKALLNERRPLSARVGRAALATLAWLEEGDMSKDVATLYTYLSAYLSQEDAPIELRRLALRSLPATHSAVQTARLAELYRRAPELRAEIIDVLADCGEPTAGQVLAEVAADGDQPIELRADACAGLAAYLPAQADVLERLSRSEDPRLRVEAERSLRTRTLEPESAAPSTPSAEFLANGDPAAGRRVFFRSTGGRCSACHAYDGRGGSVGPDLTTIHRRADRQWLWNAIVDPNRDVAPRFTAVTLVTHDGLTLSGQLVPGPGDDAAETIVDANGRSTTVPLERIAERHSHRHSIMPERLAELLDEQELADLLAFLSAQEGR